MWYKAATEECSGGTGMPQVRLWPTHFSSICEILFTDVAGLITADSNINPPVQAWLQCWLKDILHSDIPPLVPDEEAYEGGEPTTLHWHQKVGVTAIFHKTSQPLNQCKENLPLNASPTDQALACSPLIEGWANSSGILRADDVGTGKTPQKLAIVAGIMQLYQGRRISDHKDPLFWCT